jgi:hypothetical protein
MNLDPSAKYNAAKAAGIRQGGHLNAICCEDGHIAG